MRRPPVRRVRSTPGPIITLTSDFGLCDCYVASMKAVLLRHCPHATLIDVTHDIPRQDVTSGSVTLERAVNIFSAGVTHLVVVDPGVGTQRRLLVVEINGSIIVCPDNGLVTWAWRVHPGGNVRELTWRPEHASETFHGRDIMAPVAGMIAAGIRLAELSQPISDPILLDIAPVETGAVGEVIHIDHFGNATTNLTEKAVLAFDKSGPSAVRIDGRNVGRLRRTYGDVMPGKPLALLGSSGLLEVAVRNGSAAAELKISVGDTVELR